ncbi:MAG: hypothetical protein V2I33_16640 [Kangiellaceae bacterium]|nr:hypothetical protein [Kangiellaceae bacterium]
MRGVASATRARHRAGSGAIGCLAASEHLAKVITEQLFGDWRIFAADSAALCSKTGAQHLTPAHRKVVNRLANQMHRISSGTAHLAKTGAWDRIPELG